MPARAETPDGGPSSRGQALPHDASCSTLKDAEAMLRGELEPLHPLSKHEGHRNELRAFLTGDGSVKELPAAFD
jgi:hypothetical protein